MISNILRPLSHRVSFDVFCVEGLVNYYVENGAGNQTDFSDSRAALERIAELNHQSKNTIENLENFAKLVELERDLIGIDNLVQPNRVSKTRKA